MRRSVDALFSLQEMDSKRIRVLHQEKASNLIQSPFDYFADLTVEPRPDVGVTQAMYVANFYQNCEGSNIAYTFQLMCPRTYQEDAMSLFLKLAQAARVDAELTKKSPLGGKVAGQTMYNSPYLSFPLIWGLLCGGRSRRLVSK